MTIMWVAPTDEEIAELLRKAKTVAIVGASDNPERPVYGVSQWLLDNSHFDLFFVNPRLQTLFGHKVYPSIADIPEWVDIVDVFRNVADIPTVLDESIAVKAKSMWLQLGLKDDVSANRAVKNGLQVVQNRCIKIDYNSLLLKN
jgi:predicted CoA-binding protein